MDSLMGMSDSMDMSSSGSFRGINSALARDYWYIIAGVVGFMILLRAIESVQSRSRCVLIAGHIMSLPVLNKRAAML